MTSFSVDLYQNKYLSTSDRYLHAVLVVRIDGVAKQSVAAAEVLLVDCSSSMDWPPTKIANARKAAEAAIDSLRDGTMFAIVSGTATATMRFPATEELCAANPDTRARAKAVAANLVANGGTAMSTWLALANRLLGQHPHAIRHALLLTDGVNQGEAPADLHRVLDQCRGRFTCDARGIGDDWKPEELRTIASVLQGTADAVVEDEELVADFGQIIQSSMGKVVRDLRLRIHTPPFVEVDFVWQVAPTRLPLVSADVADGGVEVATGPWGEETREFLIGLRLDDLSGRPQLEDLQLGRVGLATEDAIGTLPAELPILGHITGDVTLSTQIHDLVSRHTVQAKLTEKLGEGWANFGEGDRDAAARAWGEAAKMATELGNEEVLRRLRRLVDIEDAARGLVHLKESVRPRDGFSLILSDLSWQSDAAREPVPVGEPVKCPQCKTLSPAGSAVCMANGHPLGGAS
ncbi:VWA domain-containing protein [Kibdelosporangium philippinense]|uniref:VWA domain-containing protein n=1 Tax=Kibdelosporangium philippinense TaxID=211113 RepID=A0ABS8ZUW7_9PSEU|nr:vWA domain-containing protein [Kibdelosporangium philippinense]MCE7010218.1 VWA domain-containing protein [Kibdelosporangium philippinense]